MGVLSWRRLTAAIAVLVGLCTTSSAQSENLGELNGQVENLYSAGKYLEAVPGAQRALELAETQHAPEPVIAAAMDRLALLYKLLGRYAESEPLYKRAVDIHRRMPFDPDLPAALNNLAQLHDVQGRYADAEPLLIRALDLWEKAVGPDDPAVATACNNLGQLYDHQGRYAEAEPQLKRALAIREQSLAPGDPAIARTLNNLALLHEHQGRYTEAEPLYKRALDIAEKALPPDHPTLARIRENLGGFYKSRGKRGEAEPLLKSALAAKEKALGLNNQGLASTLAQLGDLYRLEGNCREAEKQFARARDVAGRAITEVSVVFGTDRSRDDSTASPAFGTTRSKMLSYGVNVVQVTNPETSPLTTRQSAAAKGMVSIASADADAANRLPQHCYVSVENLGKLFEDPSRATPKQALVFVHGYNVDFDSAVRRAAQIAHDMNFDGNMFLFSWPAHRRLLDYFRDSQTVNLAEGDLYDFLQQIESAAKPTKMHFIAHSMGNMVLLRALERLSADPKLRPLIGEVINASPDVDPEYYELLTEKINGSAPDEHVGRFTLYAAQSDWALRISSWIWGPRAGLIYDRPLIAPGVDTIDITYAGSSNFFDLNHDIYVSSPVIVGDMHRIVERGARPPDKRTSEFQAFVSGGRTYWGVPAPAKAPK